MDQYGTPVIINPQGNVFDIGISSWNNRHKDKPVACISAVETYPQGGFVFPSIFRDLLSEAHLLDETLSAREIALEAMVDKFLGWRRAGNGAWYKGNSVRQHSQGSVEIEHLMLWKQLAAPLMEELKKQNLLDIYTEVILPVIPVIRLMKDTGVGIDDDNLQKTVKSLAKESKTLRSAIPPGRRKTPEQILQDLKAKQLMYKFIDDPFSVLSLNPEDGVPDQEIESLRRWVEIEGKIMPVLNKLQNRTSLTTGRIHPSYNMAGSETGRISVSNPPLQGLPKKGPSRSVIATGKGNLLLSADLEQMEFVVMSYLSGDTDSIEEIRQGRDQHESTALLLNQPRPVGKMVNFTILYGGTAYGLGRKLHIPETEADKFIQMFWSRHAQIREFRDRTVRDMRQNGYVVSPYGRRRRFPDIASADRWEVERMERQAFNFMAQSTSADFMKVKIVKLHRALPSAAKMVLLVHDEILLEVEEPAVEEVKSIVKEIMESPEDVLRGGLHVKISTGHSWSDTGK
jgi:DNA polymerase-1